MIGLVVLSMLLSSGQLADPSAPAQAGRLLCHAPDETQKTCFAIVSYHSIGDDRFQDTTQARFAFDDLSVTYTIKTTMTLKNREMCYVLRPAQVQAIQMKVSGGSLTGARQAMVRKEIAAHFDEYVGKESCTAFEQTPEGLAIRTKVNGVHEPDADQYVKWVAPNEGYRLGP